MMKSGYYLIAFLFFSHWANAQQSGFDQKAVDSVSGDSILIGYVTRDSLQGSVFCSWFSKNYREYHPDQDVLSELMTHSDLWRSIRITVIMATWSGQSRVQIARFFKFLDNLQCYGKCTIIALDRQQRAGPVPIGEFKITQIPTIIFFRKGMEIGRITGTPTITLEEDFYKIVKTER